MVRLKKFLGRKGAKVKIIYLPNGEGGQKVGVVDYLAAGHTLADLRSLAGPLKQLPAANRRRNQADRLIDYALDSGAELFVDQVGAPHVLVSGEALPLGTLHYALVEEGRTSGNRVSVYEAADILGVTVDAIRKRISRGSIPHERDKTGACGCYWTRPVKYMTPTRNLTGQ
jgi:hypothetical protein